MIAFLREAGAKKKEGEWGADEGDFDNPLWLVKLGWQLYRASNYTRIPARAEVLQLEPEWVSDLIYMQQLFDFHTNQSPLFTTFEKQRKAQLEARGDQDIPG